MGTEYKILVEDPEAKRMLVDLPRHVYGNTIKMEPEELWYEVVGCVHVVQDKKQW
jgi:hypothetical protein